MEFNERKLVCCLYEVIESLSEDYYFNVEERDIISSFFSHYDIVVDFEEIDYRGGKFYEIV